MKKKMFGAVLLSAALAVGTCIPAFAVDDPTQTDIDGDQGTTAKFNSETASEMSNPAKNAADTAVKVYTTEGQLQATLPISISVVAQNTGGPLLVTPTGDLGISEFDSGAVFAYNTASSQWQINGNKSGNPATPAAVKGYRIENTGELPFVVQSVSAKIQDATGKDQTSHWAYSANSKIAANAAKSAGVDTGDIVLNIKQNTNAIPDASATIANDGTGADAAVIKTDGTKLNWAVGKKDTSKTTLADTGIVPIKIGGYTSVISGAVDTALNTASEVVVLTFTIGQNTIS